MIEQKPQHKPKVRVLRRAVFAVAVVLVAAVAIAGACFYVTGRSALPQLDGTVTVAGLRGPVTVIRDGRGVPHIRADNLSDLFLAQGYVTAQDRLWQLDVLRRYAGGELSEILGEPLVAHDRAQRILGLGETARRALPSLARRDRDFVEQYARGVNASIEVQRRHLPLEFRILRYEPRPWSPEDTLLIAAYMCQMLNHHTFAAELGRERVIAKIGASLAADLYPESSPADAPPGSSTLPGSIGVTADIGSGLVPGSNNWVVSGAHTASGKPVLSNDMHLQHQMPNLWYEVHLQSGSFNVAGVSLPGAPFIIVGHNDHIAWGFTNLGPDVEDIYVEDFNARGEYRTPQGWRSPERRREVIRVKGKPDVELDVLTTRHGPIVTELVRGETRKLALRWVLYDPGALRIPFFAVDSACNWDEFRAAFSRLGGPSQNVVYADASGHIGYQAFGFIPMRAGPGGDVPVSGADDTHEWTGYIPFEKLPSVLDPPSGILATANGRITPDGYGYLLSRNWDAPYRTERILSVLKSGRKLRPADMLQLQNDVYSGFDQRMARRFADAVDRSGAASALAREAATLLKEWDGRLTTDSAAATIATKARTRLVRMILEPKLGEHFDYYHWFMMPVWLENTLRTEAPQWLPPGYTSYKDLLVAALDEAMRNGAPRDIRQWTWGREFPLVVEHPVFRNFPLLRRWSAPGLQEQSGGSYTVKQVGRDFGPSQRMTVDFSDFDRSTLNTVTGQSGNLFSPHYMDQWSAWYQGTTFELPFTQQAVERSQAHRLVLEPNGQ